MHVMFPRTGVTVSNIVSNVSKRVTSVPYRNYLKQSYLTRVPLYLLRQGKPDAYIRVHVYYTSYRYVVKINNSVQ
jgi:hypothetical protein